MIQDAYVQRTQDGLSLEQQTFKIARKGMNGLKSKRGSILPDVYTSHAQEVSSFISISDRITQLMTALVFDDVGGNRGCSRICPETGSDRTAQPIGCCFERSTSSEISTAPTLRG